MKEELEQFIIDIDTIKPTNEFFENLQEAIEEMRKHTLIDRFEVVLNGNLINCVEIRNKFRTIFGCRISFENLDRNVSFIVKEDIKPSYEELEKRIENCEKYLKVIESHDFSSTIPNAILRGDYDYLKERLAFKNEARKEMGYEIDDESLVIEQILRSED